MTEALDRELTTLAYLVLGLISLEPQSGYTILSTFESDRFRWSASPGSVYPINTLSLHHQLIIQAGFLEMGMQREWIQMARRRLQGETNEAAKL